MTTDVQEMAQKSLNTSVYTDSNTAPLSTNFSSSSSYQQDDIQHIRKLFSEQGDDGNFSQEVLSYFRDKLVRWKQQILADSCENVSQMQANANHEPDFIDFASNEIARSMSLRTQEREKKLIHKIDAALARIEDGSYGFCQETGEPIGFERLNARPVATLTIEAQERHEKKEKIFCEL